MNIEKIKKNIVTKYIGRNIIYYETINSTQDKAKELAKENAQNGSIVMVDEQTKGRRNTW